MIYIEIITAFILVWTSSQNLAAASLSREKKKKVRYCLTHIKMYGSYKLLKTDFYE